MKPKLLLCLAFVLSIASTTAHSEDTDVATNSLNDISAKVQAGYSNFIPAVSNLMGTNYGPAATKAMAGLETNMLTALTNSAMLELGASAKFLLELKKQGNLPGISADGHGTVTTENRPLSELQVAKYPFAMTFLVVPSGDSLTNHYIVLRPAMDAPWRLTKAWRTDADGHTVKEWPVK